MALVAGMPQTIHPTTQLGQTVVAPAGDNLLIKQRVQERAHGNYQVEGVQFDTLSADEIARYAEIEVLNGEKYDIVHRTPMPYGSLDSRLGCVNKTSVCGTCNQRLEDCVGHFGHVKLALPVFHVGFLSHIHNVVQCICKTCGRLLVREADRARFLNRLRKPTTDDLQRSMLFKKMVAQCKKMKHCPFCNGFNTMVKKGTGVPLLLKHNLSGKAVPEEVRKYFDESFRDARAFNPDIDQHAEKALEDVSPLTAYHLFMNLPTQDRELLQIDNPERMLITSIPVPPVVLRPTVQMGDAGMSEDDLTHAITEIITANTLVKNHLDKGGLPKQLHEAWKFLQDQCSLFINSEATGLDLPTGRPIRSLCTRLKGKEGRFRGNLSGKRVDFSGRTVISPDPNVSVEEVVVPEWIAKRMTFPERVCEANIERLRQAIRNGPEEHPGAHFIRQTETRGRHLGALRKNFRIKLADSLRYGEVVERHMRDGDVVLFNRQPSLHRLSIMAHKAKVMPGRTLRFNECVCAPYNADFDGDEMNIHLPQTEEARAEAIELMGVRHGLVTPKSGEVVVHATQDFLTASFLLTQKNVFFTRDKFSQVCCSITDGLEHVELPPPAILKPVEMWTGKQVFNVLLRPNRKTSVFVNLEAPEKNYTKKGESFCVNDGYVIFRNSELLSGNLGKKILGGAKNGLFFRIIRDNSSQAAVACMSRIAKFTSRWLMNRGMTIGIDDVTAHAVVKAEKARITKDKYAVVDEKIKEYNNGTLTLKPGCNAEQTLEALVNGELGRIRDLTGDMCEKRLHFMNKPRIMAQCGSKGSPVNLCQMMACVGQQNVGGQRIKDGFVKRTLPHFQKGSKEPKARGFVANSFYTGLEPPEFFFHTMGGREGLVDTAVKTADTGYMARRLMKALEDLSLKYDYTVRTSAGEVVQFIFGDDGLNPAKMETTGSKPLDFDYVMQHVQSVLRPPRVLVDGAIRTKLKNSSKTPSTKRRRVNSDTSIGGAAAGVNGSKDDASQQPATSSAEAPVKSAGSSPALKCAADPDGVPVLTAHPGKQKPAIEQAIAAGVLLPIPAANAFAREAVTRSASELQHLEYRARPLLPIELQELAPIYADNLCTWARRTHGSAELDLSHINSDLRGYITKLALRVVTVRENLNLDKAMTVEEAAIARASATPEEDAAIADAGFCPTQWQLETFINRCAAKYVQAMLLPGEAVGAVAAQSIAEPATQMTLKTFHFAGVASMNVTLGVPRIKEIINAAKTVSTPIISCTLYDEYNEVTARIVKGRIEATRLGEVCLYFKEVYEPALGCFISVKLDLETISKLQLEMTIEQVKDALLDYKNLSGIRLTSQDVEIIQGRRDKLRVRPSSKTTDKRLMYFSLQSLKQALPRAIVHGVRSTRRAVINKDDKGEKMRYNILVEGYGLQQVMAIPGINPTRTTSNHIIEVEKVFGIEAARRTIMSEITTTMGQHGISVDARHIQMLGDCMTYRGQVLGINRYGISRMRTSALMLASFERTNDHIFDAAAHRRNDPVTGVSECIILGSTIKLGTGLFKLLYDPGSGKAPKVARTPLLSEWRRHVNGA